MIVAAWKMPEADDIVAVVGESAMEEEEIAQEEPRPTEEPMHKQDVSASASVE
jgi:hypothetical protein